MSDASAVVRLQVDEKGFEQELDSQKKRSREAYKNVDLTAGSALGNLAGQLGTSDFIGYEHGSLRAEASVLAILREGKTVDSASAGEDVEVVLDRTPFYAESGGQVLPAICCVSNVCFGQACPPAQQGIRCLTCIGLEALSLTPAQEIFEVLLSPLRFLACADWRPGPPVQQ